MTFYDKWFGKGRLLARARSAELRGDFDGAVELFDQAGAPEDIARIFLLRGESETDPRARLGHFTRAAKVAPEGTETNKTARSKRAELLLALAGEAAVSAVARHEIIAAARDLEAIGEPLKAAEAFARAGDKEGEARALQAAGDVERLEFLLATEAHEHRVSRTRDERLKDAELMIACGRRREALETLEALLVPPHEADGPLRERIAGLRARRVLAPITTIETLSPSTDSFERYRILLGEIVIGRTEGTIKVPSNAVSRRHLEIIRDGQAFVVRDLGSRNGTQLRGINVTGMLPIGEGLELKLGKEVPLRLAPSQKLPGALEIEVAGERYQAFLGNAQTPIAGLSLAVGADGWLELASNEAKAFIGDVELAPRTTLLAGDAFSTTRKGTVVLRVLGE